MTIERKARLDNGVHTLLHAPLEIKSLDESGRFAGYASVFDVIDNQRDAVLRGAFTKTLNERSQPVKLLWQHRFDEPIGIIERLFEDANGLYVEGRLLLQLEKAREVHALLKAGVIQGMSIGYTPVQYRTDPDSGVRLLGEVELWEISLVTFPANQEARITVVKGNTSTPEEFAHAWQLLELSDALDRAAAELT